MDDRNAELMRNAADGDIQAFQRLYRTFGPVIKHLFAKRGVNPALSDDLVQKIFVCLWQQRKDFRAESSFETYLFSIARYTLSNEIRRSCGIAGKDLKDQPEYCIELQNGLSQPEAELYLKELAAAVERAKAKLTTEQRQALDAANDVDIPLGKALEGIGCSHRAYKSRLKRARKRLRELLDPFLEKER